MVWSFVMKDCLAKFDTADDLEVTTKLCKLVSLSHTWNPELPQETIERCPKRMNKGKKRGGKQ